VKNEKRKKLKGRILSYILTSALIVGLMLNNVLTVSAEESTFVIDNLKYQILTEAEGENPGTVSVMGYENKPNGAVTIPDSVTDSSKQYSVTSIGGSAFSSCSDLTSVTIPSSVTSIGDRAFYYCSGLTSMEFGANSQLTSIGMGTFYYCSGLTSVTIPSSVESIGYGAFSGCSGLTSVTIPDSVESIGDGAFFYCSDLTSVTIPSSVVKAFCNCFSECAKLTSVTIMEGAKTIDAFAFSGCSGLTSVTIPSSVESIGDYAFNGCSGLTSVTIPSSVESIGDGAFSGCSGLTSVTIPSSVESIGGSAFSSCSGLTSVTIPSSVVNDFGNYFSACKKLTSVTIMEGAKTIGDSAFYGCSSLTSVTIPDSVTSIEDSAFEGCSGLTSVTIPSSVESIGDSAFNDCSGLESVTIPDSVTSIGLWAFDGCSGLTSVTIPSSVESIGDYAFEGCSGLTSVTIPASVVNNFKKCFSECEKLTSVTIMEGVKTIYDSAFSGCSGLTSVTIPSSVESIGESAFSGCSGLTSVEFGTNSQLTSIGQLAFWNCIGLESITIPSNVESIGYGAFLSCNLTTVNVPCTWNFETPLYNFGSVTPTVYHVGEQFTVVNNSIHDSCSCGEEVRSTATIRATGGTYNGSAYGASVSYSDDWTSGELTIHYTKNGENSSTTDAPSNAGSYNASITVGEGEDAVTASEVFEIMRKELTVTEATATGRMYEKGNTSVAITGVTLSGIANEDEVSGRTTDLTGTLSSANAGAYTEVTLQDLTLSGKDKDNYVVTQASKTVPTNVTISPKATGTAQNVTKNYPFLQENADTINLGSLLPEDCGTVVSYGTPDVRGDITYKSPFRRLSVGGTNSNESFNYLYFSVIIALGSYTTKHGEVSCKNFLRFRQHINQCKSHLSSTNKWLYKTAQ